MTAPITRRQFLGSAVASSSFAIVPRHVLGGPGYVPPSERITLAHIGMGTQGFNELGGLLDDPRIEIVAVCDPNRDSNDYVEWHKHSVRDRIRQYLGDDTWREGVDGCPGGREVGRRAVDAYYANHRGRDANGGCRAYADFRELLDAEADLDAVKIMTPDHLHASIAIAAMGRGAHCLMHKPIANRLAEGRMVLEAARRSGRATHLLAYGSGAGNAGIARRVRSGIIGTLREIHNWTNRPVWPQYDSVPTDQPPIPDGFDWNLWLGPERDRPFHPHYTHTVFRGWYDFGGGSMADMGIYSLWPVFTELGLDAPVRAEAQASHTCAIADQVSRTVDNEAAYPAACTLRFGFAARDDRPALDLFWYDGGMRPRLPDPIEAHGIRPEREGILFIGDDGMILAGFHGQSPEWFAGGQRRPLLPEETDDESPRPSTMDLWIGACRGEAPSPGSFLHAGPITDAVNLGTVALRAGRTVHFDSKAMTITNPVDADRFLHRDYRPGWEPAAPAGAGASAGEPN